MFYQTDLNEHGLAHDPFKAIVAPRPIGWIGTQDDKGIKNLAPYSYFNAIAEQPKLVMFSSMGEKDSVRNCRKTGAFSVNMVGLLQVDVMNESSANFAADQDEFTECDIGFKSCQLIDAPYVEDAFAVLECVVTDISSPQTIKGAHRSAHMVTGEVVGIHIQERVISDGRLDVTKAQPVSRLGYFDYSHIERIFELKRP